MWMSKPEEEEEGGGGGGRACPNKLSSALELFLERLHPEHRGHGAVLERDPTIDPLPSENEGADRLDSGEGKTFGFLGLV